MKTKNKILFLTLVSFLLAILSSKPAFAITEISGGSVSTSTVPTDDAIVFTGGTDGTLSYDQALDRTISTISTDHDGIGIIDFNSGETLIINGDVGSTSNRINQIVFSQVGILQINGSLFTSNVIGVDASAFDDGEIHFSGNNSTVSAVLGTSSDKLGTITAEGVNVTFNKNLFTSFFTVSSNKSATLSSSITSADLGATELLDNSTLNLQSNTSVSTLNTTSSSTITIAAGKQLSGSGVFDISGTLNIGIARSDVGTASISSDSNITVNNGSVIHFDYSNANYLNSTDHYNFLTTDATLDATTSTFTITDNSILLTPTVTKITGSNHSLRVTQTIDSDTTSQLNAGDLTAANFLIDNTTAADIDLARTALFKISTQEELEGALGTVQADKSNMLQNTSNDIAQSIEKVTKYRLHSLNYNQFATFGEKDKYGNDVKTKNGGLWGEVFGGTSTQDDIASLAANNSTETKGYDANFGGVSFGWDHIAKGKNSNSIWGSTISYAQAQAKSNSLSNQKTDINSYQIALYNYNAAKNATKNGLGFFNDNLLSVGYNQYDSDRMITIGSYQSKATADFTGVQYGARIGFGYNFQMTEKTIFAPIVGIKYFGLQLQDYQEKNTGGFGLKVQNDYFDLTTSEIGFKMLGKIGSRIEPQINISWLHNLNYDGAKSSSTFVNGSGTQDKIQNTGIDLDADILDVGTQIKFRTSNNTSMMLRYDMQKSSNFTSHLGSVRFGWAF